SGSTGWVFANDRWQHSSKSQLLHSSTMVHFSHGSFSCLFCCPTHHCFNCDVIYPGDDWNSAVLLIHMQRILSLLFCASLTYSALAKVEAPNYNFDLKSLDIFM